MFLLGWEMMALSAFFLVSTEDHLASCREAGWIYLVATHIGTLGLFAMLALWRWATGSFDLVPAAEGVLSVGVQHSLFLLALLVFGLKAGMMPLHFWLPTAHANAPSHVSAILSGVVLKIGIYGLLRMLSLLPNPPAAWGGLILLLAACSALLGVVFALGQHDLKRLLAYHSVENIGIILMGLGLAMLGRSLDRPTWMVLGMAGCLLHVWNHSFFKSLLFFCAGSVLHSAHTREIDRLGGLAKRMPSTAFLFQIGAVAICGLPPLNGFVSELLIYLGLLASVVAPTGGGIGRGLGGADPGDGGRAGGGLFCQSDRGRVSGHTAYAGGGPSGRSALVDARAGHGSCRALHPDRPGADRHRSGVGCGDLGRDSGIAGGRDCRCAAWCRWGR